MNQHENSFIEHVFPLKTSPLYEQSRRNLTQFSFPSRMEITSRKFSLKFLPKNERMLELTLDST